MKKIFFVIFFLLFFLIHPFGKDSIVNAQACGIAGDSCGRIGDPLCCAAQGFTCNTFGNFCETPLIPIPTGGITTTTPFKMCEFIEDATQKTKCNNCFDNDGSWTAIGCIKTDIAGFFKTLMTFAMGIAGGIAFLLILLGGFQILTSAGNPEQLNAGKELVGSAITGLLLIIFSVFFLKIIGVDILGIPGWKV